MFRSFPTTTVREVSRFDKWPILSVAPVWSTAELKTRQLKPLCRQIAAAESKALCEMRVTAHSRIPDRIASHSNHDHVTPIDCKRGSHSWRARSLTHDTRVKMGSLNLKQSGYADGRLTALPLQQLIFDR